LLKCQELQILSPTETNPPNLSRVLGRGASRNQGKSKIEKQNKMKNKMKNKINKPNSPSSTTSPLSSQERGRGEFVENRDELVDERD
jgi:hypothetical protein